MKVDVYYNLNKGSKNKPCYSVKSREKDDYGKVVLHACELLVKDCKFVVRPSGHQRALEQEQRNVHAFVRGELVFYQLYQDTPQLNSWDKDGVRFTYDISNGSFISEDDRELKEADSVFFSSQTKVANGPVYIKNEFSK